MSLVNREAEAGDSQLPRRSRLLVAVDRSRAAPAAAEVAGKIAVALNADVSVLHAHEVGFSDRGSGTPERNALRVLRGLGATAHVEPRSGEPVEEILGAVRALKPDLLVMGTRGRSNLTGLLLGSVSQEVIARAACPVLLVRADTGAVGAPYRIVLAVEGLGGLKPLVDITKKLAGALAAKVYAVHVAYPGGEAVERAIYHAPRGHGEQAAAAAAEWLSSAGVEAEAVTLTARSGVPRALAEYAGSIGADLIVMGAHVAGDSIDARIGPAVSVAHVAEQPVLVAREDSDPR